MCPHCFTPLCSLPCWWGRFLAGWVTAWQPENALKLKPWPDRKPLKTGTPILKLYVSTLKLNSDAPSVRQKKGFAATLLRKE